MKKLNPITALYLKILEVISFLLIEVGGRIDAYMYPDKLTPEERLNFSNRRRRLRRINRSWGQWY